MLRITVNKSAAGAKKYYSELYYGEGQSRESYYSEKGESIGKWNGRAAEMLGLKGEINKDDFGALCDNLVPGRNQQLTERNNTERRVGYDFTFNATKSVSLAYTFGNDEDKKRILKAFQLAVKKTMLEIEDGMQARVRQKGQNDNRSTKNIVYGEFIHFTSRPVEGLTDPHLHAHCFIFNTTYDHVENKWKAGEFGQVNTDAPYYEAVFHSHLANKLQQIGYGIEKNQTGFELRGISRNTIEKFSRRTAEIEMLAKEKGITDQKEKGQLGAKTRESKRKTLEETEQIKEWNQRLSVKEKTSIENLRTIDNPKVSKDVSIDLATKAIEDSLNHNLERKSVCTDKEILCAAIKSTIGKANVNDVKMAFKDNNSILVSEGILQTLLTSKEALFEENNLIAKAFNSKGCFKPIHETYLPKTENLTNEQKFAIQYALTTSDGIVIIAGKAGTGKTTLMKEVQSGIIEGGKKIFAFAPSAEASRMVQRKEGFAEAETLATLFNNKALQENVRNSILWIDEAGMISNKDMNKVLDIAKQQNARIILTGDTKQHNSVERGDALRVLQKDGGIMPIEVTKIQRQKNQLYKDAVSALSKSDVDKGFKQLERMGAINEIEESDKRIRQVSKDYIESTYQPGKVKPKEVLVIAPTHAEGDKITHQIREGLKERGIVAKKDQTFLTFKNRQLTTTEKQFQENYTSGNWIVFHQNSKGFKAGSRFEVQSVNEQMIIKDAKGRDQPLPLDKSACFHVFEARQITLAAGDKIRITGNGKALTGKNLFNGSLFEIKGFDNQGNPQLSNGAAISKDYGHFTLGYVITSHASQGKTVDKVILSQSSMSFRASSKEQFYVSVSRGRESVAIYTDDKADLLRAVSQSVERKSARELLKEKALNHAIEVSRRTFIQRVRERAKGLIEKVTGVNKQNGYGLQRHTIAKETGRGR